MEPLRIGDPRQVGAYRLLGRLGAGGMGQVFLGESPGGRKVAVKLILPQHTADAEFRRRFAREVAAARQVGGFHTAPVVDADPDDDPPWMVTAYIPGSSLDAAVRQNGPLEPGAVCRLGTALAEGLAAVHACGLVHRDLKPGNIILAEDGPRIIDFGIARPTDATALTSSGVLIGTFSFMSPEQVRGEHVDRRSDIFALGSVLAYAATGHGPFDAASLPAIVHRISGEPPDLQGISGPLCEIIGACLVKDAAARPSLNDLMARLSGAARAVTAADDAPAARPPAEGVSTRSARPEQGAVTASVAGMPRQPSVPVRHPDPRPRWSARSRTLALSAAAVACAAAAAFAISLLSNDSTGNHPSGTAANSSHPGTSAASAAGNSTAPANATGSTKTCAYTATGNAARPVSPPPAKTDPAAGYTAVLRTNRGNIVIKLRNAQAPCTVNSFVHLADAGFWDASQCHRLSTTSGLYMLQCGDPTATASATLNCSSDVVGTGGPGYEFASENLTGAAYPAGTVAMANAGTADSNGSQFFLVYQDTTLPPDYTPFGTITSGLGILRNVASAGTSCTYAGAGGGVPRDKVVIDGVTIAKA